MSIKINNFVDINIVRSVRPLSAFEYNTAVYVVGTTAVDAYGYYANIPDALASGADGTKAKPYSKDTLGKTSGSFTPDALGAIFFNNNGQYLHVVANLKFDTTEKCWQYTYNGTKWIDLPLPEIVIFKSSSASVSDWNLVKSSIDQKIFIDSVTSDAAISDGDQKSGSIKKYTTASTGAATNIAAVAAYFTNVKLDDASTIKDYAFTAEMVDTTDVVDQNSVVANCIGHNLNVDAYVAGAVRNIGGNDSTGEDIMNLFMRIALQQTAANRALQVIVSKVQLNTQGIAQIQSAITDELNRYVANGYISTEKIWTSDDLYINGELIIAHNNPLAGGYKVYIDKISAQNQADHSAPDIYIIYGDQVGIRFIKISGEVF